MLCAEAWKSLNDSDAVLFIVDTVKKPDMAFMRILKKISPRKDILNELIEFLNPSSMDNVKSKILEDVTLDLKDKKTNNSVNDQVVRPDRPVLLLLNKMDLVEDRKWLKVRNIQISEFANFNKCFYVSAKEGKGIDKVMDHLRSIAIPGEWSYPSTTITTLSMTDQIEQLVRSFLFTWFNKDVPYRVQQQTVGWTERLDGTLVIEHELIVKDSVVARMILGTNNRLIRRLKENIEYKLKKNWKIEKINFLIFVKSRKQRKSKRDKMKESRQGLAEYNSRGSGF